MSELTITLAGSEEKAEFAGGNAWLRNDGADVIYAAKSAGITAGADGVVAIPAGQSAPVYGANGTVFLLGTGSVQLIGSDYSTNPFKTSASSGGSGADSVARAAISAHAGNADIHVTAAEKAAWNAVNYSNANLLMNPDFRINQRGESEYTSGYTVDGWFVAANKCSASPEEDGILIKVTAKQSANTHAFQQNLEFPLSAGKYTLSLNVSDVSGTWAGRIRIINSNGTYIKSHYTGTLKPGVNTLTVDVPEGEYIDAVTATFNANNEIGDAIKLKWIKLEQGEIATPYTPPDPATELAKCQRYLVVYSSAFANGANNTWVGQGVARDGQTVRVDLTLPEPMRTTPSITADNMHVFDAASGARYTCTDIIPLWAISQNKLTVQATVENGSMTAYDYVMLEHYAVSKLILSAEL